MKNQSIDVKFAVVAFGGSGELENPQIVSHNGEVFTTSSNIRRFLNHLKEGNGTSDVFTALTIASKIIFRSGSAKIFVLSLCSKCEYNFLKVRQSCSTKYNEKLNYQKFLHSLTSNRCRNSYTRMISHFMSSPKPPST